MDIKRGCQRPETEGNSKPNVRTDSGNSQAEMSSQIQERQKLRKRLNKEFQRTVKGGKKKPALKYL